LHPTLPLSVIKATEIRSQGGRVGYSLDFQHGRPGLTPSRNNQQKKKKLKPLSVPG